MATRAELELLAVIGALRMVRDMPEDIVGQAHDLYGALEAQLRPSLQGFNRSPFVVTSRAPIDLELTSDARNFHRMWLGIPPAVLDRLQAHIAMIREAQIRTAEETRAAEDERVFAALDSIAVSGFDPLPGQTGAPSDRIAKTCVRCGQQFMDISDSIRRICYMCPDTSEARSAWEILNDD